MPCTIKLGKVLKNRKPQFYDDDQLSRLVAAASGRTADVVTVLLGADAGLRRGEPIGLEWDDLDLVRGHIPVGFAPDRAHSAGRSAATQRTGRDDPAGAVGRAGAGR